MRILIQRVKKASVIVNDTIYSSIGRGLLIFLGIGKNDTQKDMDYCVSKVINLRIFYDKKENKQYSLLDFNYDLMLVSQFTLYADCGRGMRPSFTMAMNTQDAYRIYSLFIKQLQSFDINFKTGVFGEDMDIQIVNDGPFTVFINSDNKF